MENNEFNFIAYSSTVSEILVESLALKTNFSPSKQPSTIFVFPTSITKIINNLPY